MSRKPCSSSFLYKGRDSWIVLQLCACVELDTPADDNALLHLEYHREPMLNKVRQFGCEIPIFEAGVDLYNTLDTALSTKCL